MSGTQGSPLWLPGPGGNMVKPLYSKEPVDARAFQETFDNFYTKTARHYLVFFTPVVVLTDSGRQGRTGSME